MGQCISNCLGQSRMSKHLRLVPRFERSHGFEKLYGKGRWRKRKGIARVRLSDGSVHLAEIHWYEATGIGRKEYKIKRLL